MVWSVGLNSTSLFLAMSSEPLQNLPCSINRRGCSELSIDVTRAVNKTLNKFYFETLYQDYLSFYKQHKSLFGGEETLATMQSEKIILCEINAGLWAKAIKSAISTLTQQTYPHYLIVQELINYLLNADTEEDFGLLENFFWQLLLFHPPGPEMFDYYYQIIFNHFVVLNNKIEEKNLFVCLLEACISSLQNMVTSTGNNECSSDFVNENNHAVAECSEQKRMAAIRKLNVMENDFSKGKATPQKVYFQDLHWNARIRRCSIALNFVYNILEMDFVFWLHSKKWKPFAASREPGKETRLLLSHVLWPDARDIGLMNKDVHRVLGLYKSIIKSNLSYQYKNLIEKHVILIGEVIRCSDSVEGIKYPFVGTKSENFLRELSVILHEVVVGMCQATKLPKDEPILDFRPPWLRLFLCSHLLSSITGSRCLPELTTAHDVLTHIIHNENRSKDAVEPQKSPRKTKNSRLRKNLRSLKTINAKLASGKTNPLHLACQNNHVEEIKALLAFSGTDVNVTDSEGWTALHVAAYAGNADSVKELLLFSPQWGDPQKPANARARGPQSVTPIMCAALRSHTDVCRILLEHSGSVLLEDTNEFNQTALELADSPEVTKVLEHYKKNNVSTFHSHRDTSFDSDMKQLVLRLCVEMIQAYFCTHRTWDVYRDLKRLNNSSRDDSPTSEVDIHWDYMRYHRDIKRNICKLRILVPKLEKVEEFKGLHDVYVQLLSFNKVC